MQHDDRARHRRHYGGLQYFLRSPVQPLPFRDPGRLVELSESRVSRGIDHASFSEANFWDVRAQNHSFQDVAAFHYDEANLTGNGPAEKVTDRSVTVGFFRTLGVSPVLGRDFSDADDRNGFENRVVILGNKFWRSRFAGDPNIIGKMLRLNDRACMVVGVLPPGEPWIDDQVYQPFGHRADADRGSWEFSVIGRLAPGVSAEAAQADLKRARGYARKSLSRADEGIGFALSPASSWIARDKARRALWVLVGAVSFLLLIACLNIANLLLARGTARQREIARSHRSRRRPRTPDSLRDDGVASSQLSSGRCLAWPWLTARCTGFRRWRSRESRVWPMPASIHGCSDSLS